MSMSISGFTTQNLTSTQSTGGVSSLANRDSDGDNNSSSVSSVSGGGRHHGGGAFMQDALKALQAMGLNLPGVDAATTPPPASATAVSQVSSTATVGSGTSATSSDIGQALHTFLHDLHQALKQSGNAQQQSTTTDTDGDNDNSTASSSGTQTTGVQNGYSNFASNLNNLISSLSAANAPTPSATTTPSTVSSTNTPSGSGTLQADFANLISALGGSSSTSTLQDFLGKMAGYAGNSSTTPSATGNFVNHSA